MERPAGVRAIASLFFLTGFYLLTLALFMLVNPGAISMMLGSPLLGGLELAGPYMFLLVAVIGGVIGAGVLGLRNWARWLAIAAAGAGVVALMPDVSIALVEFRIGKLTWGGLGIIVRVMIVWYLFQPPVVEAFSRHRKT